MFYQIKKTVQGKTQTLKNKNENISTNKAARELVWQWFSQQNFDLCSGYKRMIDSKLLRIVFGRHPCLY
jgi:hypothetical protein